MADIWTGGTMETVSGKVPEEADVVIVGAGFSGLQAAYDLQKAGITSVVLEANARIGGRSYSYPLKSQPGIVELGATWINEDTQPKVYALTQEFRLTTVPQDGKGDVLWQDREGNTWRVGKHDPPVPPVSNPNDTLALFQILEDAQSIIDVRDPGSTRAADDMSVDEWAEKNNLTAFAREAIDFTVGGLVGGQSRNVGLHYLLDYVKSGNGLAHLMGEGPETAQALKIKEGTSAITSALAQALPQGTVVLNSAVKAVTQAKSGCLVKHVNGADIRCRKVILAIPTNTYSKIIFDPPLPEDKQAIVSRTKPGLYVKAMFTYRKPWWQELGLVGQLNSLQGPIKFSWEASDAEKRHYTLALFIDGDAVIKWQTLAESDRKLALLDHLVQLVGPEHQKKVLDTLEVNIHDWTAEPYIEGGPTSAMVPGDYARYSQALRASSGNLHFGGGELAFEWKGYLEGALLAGSRVAEEVIQELAESAM